jgi:methyl-accepting chemotaxis protein
MAAMTWFRNLNTSRKLAVAFGLLEVLMIGLGIFSLAQLSSVNATTVQIVANRMPSVRILGSLKYDTSAIRRSELSYLLAVDHKEKWDASMKQALNEFQQHEKEYQALISDEEERGIYEKFHEAWEKYVKVHADAMALTSSNEYQAGVLAQTAGNEAFEAAASVLQEDVDLNDRKAQEAGAVAASAYSSSRYWIIGLLSCAVAAGIGLSMFIGRFMSTAISGMLGQIQQIAANNLAVDDIESDSQDEIGEAGLALNRMKNNLRQLIMVITDTAHRLASASDEISTGAGEEAQSARSQADQTRQVATAMQEMAATVQQVSENSQKASQSSQQSAQAARDGGTVAEETLATMHSISDSTKKVATRITELGVRSEQIGKIAAVIDDIADQTNLLALNAAIEAARAGEQGRGFAVVADEVRKLAERTAAATKEIASMIDAIQVETKSAVQAMGLNGEKVQAGVERTQASGEALRKIIKMSEDVGDMVSQIATAAGEQSGATDEINNSISQIATLAKQSSATAEHTEKACTSLSSLALDLQNLVRQFKLTNTPGTDAQAQRFANTPPGAAPRSSKAAAAAAGSH